MKNFFLLTAIVMFAPLLLTAQTTDPELDYIKKAYSRDKKVIVEQYMTLDVDQGAKFWSIYADYESKREKLAIERINAINEYIGSNNLTDELADKLAKKALSNSVSLDKMNLDYYKKVKKAIGAVKAAKFIQLETYLQTAWRGFAQENIPLIGELDKTQKN